MPQINRSLKDPLMDDIDHALGRPANLMNPAPRNYFATDDAAYDTHPYWHLLGVRGSLRYYEVTRTGRAALWAHLRSPAATRAPQQRLYNVVFDGRPMTPCAATTRSQARYRAWLNILDVCDISFVEFQRSVQVSLFKDATA